MRGGLSPRVRGTRQLDADRGVIAGIIPACAGNTRTLDGICLRWRDHPRVCGEHALTAGAVGMLAGSSPRVRGTPLEAPWARLARRIIPACAGNTAAAGDWREVERDHPRVCGEHRPPGRFASGPAGSSPRVRGTRGFFGRAPGRDGIIPACAGNTDLPPRRARPAGDHPRVCGEHALCRRCLQKCSGSSPRVRGTQITAAKATYTGGIIPACAGNTIAGRVIAFHGWDHPRVCGEHIAAMTPEQRAAGSSPRVRGTQSCGAGAGKEPGIIPACAGNTSARAPSSRLPRDHPRVCGEHNI